MYACILNIYITPRWSNMIISSSTYISSDRRIYLKSRDIDMGVSLEI